jgi:L-amino acid N-acyltransferase YncA
MTADSLLIRPAVPDDAESIARILNPIIASRRFTVLDTEMTIEGERAFIQAFPARGIFHVAEAPDNRRILGFQNVEPFASYTAAFDHVGVIGTYVDGDFRRQGVARQLFRATIETAKQMGYEKLFTYVRADNHVALHTYHAQGFVIVGTARRHARIDGNYIDEVIIEKVL